MQCIHGYLLVASAVWHVNEVLFPPNIQAGVEDHLRSGLDAISSRRKCHTFHVSKTCFRSDHIVWLPLSVRHTKLHKYSYNDMRQSSCITRVFLL